MSDGQKLRSRTTHLKLLHVLEDILRVLRDHCRVELVDLIVEVVLNVLQLAPITMSPRCRDLGPYSLPLRHRPLILALLSLILLLMQVLFPVAQLGEVRVIRSILIDDAGDDVLLDLHLVFMADDDIGDDLCGRFLRDGDTTG